MIWALSVPFLATMYVLWVLAPEWVGWWDHDKTDCDFMPEKKIDWLTHPFKCKGKLE